MLALVFGVASAQDAAKTWDFQSDKVDEAPSGFSFGKTGQGRPGKWIVRVGKPVIDSKDDTFKEAGKVGLWTKADSVTYFDALSVKSLQ